MHDGVTDQKSVIWDTPKWSMLKQYTQLFAYIQPVFFKHGMFSSYSFYVKMPLRSKAFVPSSYLTLDNAEWDNYKFNKNLRAITSFTRSIS